MPHRLRPVAALARAACQRVCASHELRTPLTLDRALLERALRNPQPTHASWRAACERLLASSRHQDHLIDALLTLARSEGGISSYETFELSAVIDAVLLSPELDTGTMAVSIRTETGPAAVNGDPRLAERLVRNLADNAIRYNQPSLPAARPQPQQPARRQRPRPVHRQGDR